MKALAIAPLRGDLSPLALRRNHGPGLIEMLHIDHGEEFQNKAGTITHLTCISSFYSRSSRGFAAGAILLSEAILAVRGRRSR